MTDFPKFQQYLSTVFIWKLVFTAWESESNTLIHQQQCSKNKTILKMLHFKTFDNFKFLFFYFKMDFFLFQGGWTNLYEMLTQFESSNKTTIRFLSHTHIHEKHLHITFVPKIRDISKFKYNCMNCQSFKDCIMQSWDSYKYDNSMSLSFRTTA